MAEWLAHFLSPLFLVDVKSRPGLVKGCTRELLERFWAEEMEGLDINRCLADAM